MENVKRSLEVLKARIRSNTSLVHVRTDKQVRPWCRKHAQENKWKIHSKAHCSETAEYWKLRECIKATKEKRKKKKKNASKSIDSSLSTATVEAQRSWDLKRDGR